MPLGGKFPLHEVDEWDRDFQDKAPKVPWTAFIHHVIDFNQLETE
jgi:hypothetical protein